MNSKIFEIIYDRWQNKNPNERFWDEGLASEFGFSSPEAARSSFRRHRRNIEKDSKEITSNYKKIDNGCRILLYDIETSPIDALVYGMWDQNIRPEFILQDWHLLSWSAKWLFDDKTYSDVLTSKEAKSHDDKRITESIWKIMNEADVIVAHNNDKFDEKRSNTRFLVNGLPPLSHHKSVDTLKVVKYNFNFTSNALDFVNKVGAIAEEQGHHPVITLAWGKAEITIYTHKINYKGF